MIAVTPKSGAPPCSHSRANNPRMTSEAENGHEIEDDHRHQQQAKQAYQLGGHPVILVQPAHS